MYVKSRRRVGAAGITGDPRRGFPPLASLQSLCLYFEGIGIYTLTPFREEGLSLSSYDKLDEPGALSPVLVHQNVKTVNKDV